MSETESEISHQHQSDSKTANGNNKYLDQQYFALSPNAALFRALVLHAGLTFEGCDNDSENGDVENDKANPEFIIERSISNVSKILKDGKAKLHEKSTRKKNKNSKSPIEAVKHLQLILDLLILREIIRQGNDLFS